MSPHNVFVETGFCPYNVTHLLSYESVLGQCLWRRLVSSAQPDSRDFWVVAADVVSHMPLEGASDAAASQIRCHPETLKYDRLTTVNQQGRLQCHLQVHTDELDHHYNV